MIKVPASKERVKRHHNHCLSFSQLSPGLIQTCTFVNLATKKIYNNLTIDS